MALRGRKAPWPAEAEYATGWPELPWSGTRFHVEAVYQRTVVELRARGTLVWLVFTPLARDASVEALREVLDEIRRRAPAPEERGALFAALLAGHRCRAGGLASAALRPLSLTRNPGRGKSSESGGAPWRTG